MDASVTAALIFVSIASRLDRFLTNQFQLDSVVPLDTLVLLKTVAIQFSFQPKGRPVMAAWTVDSRIGVSLRLVLPAASFVGCADIVVRQIAARATDVQPQSMFAVTHGSAADAADWIRQARQRGATSLLVDRPIPGESIPQCVVPNVRHAYSEIAAAIYGYPTRKLAAFGVTGTNGKTTTAWILRNILRSAKRRCGLLGTIEYDDTKTRTPASLTTPDAVELQCWLARMVENNATHCSFELSSHALDQHRAAAVSLDAACITRITQDHFDYHKTFEHYRSSKLRILDLLRSGGIAIINLDDPGSKSCLGAAPVRFVTYSLNQPADLTAIIEQSTPHGTKFRIVAGTSQTCIRSPLVGRHNVSNCLAAAAAAIHFGIDWSDIAAGIESLTAVPGRLELVDAGQSFPVFVDFAHTPDALSATLASVREVSTGRLIVVFGAGGNRDTAKRPLMAAAVAEIADNAIVTSDNPRHESPDQIIREIVAGVDPNSKCRFEVQPDRSRAIQAAVEMAQTGDVVVIAGKGHETTQIIADRSYPFDDRAVATRHLRNIVGSPKSVQSCGCGSGSCGSEPCGESSCESVSRFAASPTRAAVGTLAINVGQQTE